MTASPAAVAAPQFHLRPTHGWLNDPNGLVHHDGRWHVFFQHNPVGPVHHHIHWGHMSSPDLVTWTEHPVAFGPTPGGPDSFGCWSGVFAPGLGQPAVVYSGVVDESLHSTICLRWGSADLTTWSEPVVVGTTPGGMGVRVMRDPFVFEHGGRRWGLLGAGLDDGTAAILLYSCDDMLDWRFEEVWLAAREQSLLSEGAPADIWECPQLVWADGVPVLVLSLQLEGVLGDVVAVMGEVAEQDGRPRFTASSVERLDTGNCFYAPQLVQDGSSPLMFGWARQEPLDTSGLGDGPHTAGCLTLPRRLAVRDGRLLVRPDPAVALLVAQESDSDADSSPGGTGGNDQGTRCVAGVHELPGAARLTVTSAPGDGKGWILRGASGSQPLRLVPGTAVWVDADVVEVYPGDGAAPQTFRLSGPPWGLEVPDGGSLRVSAVVPPTPGRREGSGGARAARRPGPAAP